MSMGEQISLKPVQQQNSPNIFELLGNSEPKSQQQPVEAAMSPNSMFLQSNYMGMSTGNIPGNNNQFNSNFQSINTGNNMNPVSLQTNNFANISLGNTYAT